MKGCRSRNRTLEDDCQDKKNGNGPAPPMGGRAVALDRVDSLGNVELGRPIERR